MSTIDFFKGLIGTIIILIILMALLSLDAELRPYLDIAQIAIPAFSVLCINVFFITKYLDSGPNKSGLLRVVIINVLVKFFLAIVIVAYYQKINDIMDGKFVLPFIIIYIAFTVFETYFMSKQAKG